MVRTFALLATAGLCGAAVLDANNAATPAEWKAAQEAAKAKAAQALARVAAEKAKAAAMARHQAIQASEKAKKANDVERNAKSNGAQRMDLCARMGCCQITPSELHPRRLVPHNAHANARVVSMVLEP